MNARIDKDAIGAVIGFGGVIAVIFWLVAAAGVAWATHLLRIYGPVIREFLLWVVEAPTFGITVVLTAILSASLTCLCALALGRIQP